MRHFLPTSPERVLEQPQGVQAKIESYLTQNGLRNREGLHIGKSTVWAAEKSVGCRQLHFSSNIGALHNLEQVSVVAKCPKGIEPRPRVQMGPVINGGYCPVP